MKIGTTSKPDKAADKIIDSGLDRHAEKYATNESEFLAIYCRDEDHTIVGGLLGDTGGGWLHIWQFWVSENHCGKSWGSKILAAAEKEAIKRGCKGSHLDTFSFQALEFYLERSYRQFGMLEDYGGVHSRHFLEKRLTS